ncbi:transcriptional regulator GcvA [Xanthobacter autotrophicus]|uniref:transcriptional regulator GcvA n=1 Tax=Xanthobacter autotrophicus TaxID=280 RepID=UPI0037288573
MRIPPLNALRTFECAGRHLSFAAAAQELNVTPGAVSRQIRTLEEFLGIRLFIRATRKVQLTAEGSSYLKAISETIAQIAGATEALMDIPEGQPLRVSTSLTFVLRWLTPRLLSYHAIQPDRNLQITTALGRVDFRCEPVDVAIRLGQEDTPHAKSTQLFRPDLVPVCSPALLDGPFPLRRVEDLRHHTLLHTSARPNNWKVWLNAVEQPDLSGAQRLRFDSSSLAYQAAAEGLGVAVGQVQLLIDDLASGKLVVPFPTFVPDTDSYNLLWSDRAGRNAVLTRFRGWVLAEARACNIKAQEIAGVITSSKPITTDRSGHYVAPVKSSALPIHPFRAQ